MNPKVEKTSANRLIIREGENPSMKKPVLSDRLLREYSNE